MVTNDFFKKQACYSFSLLKEFIYYFHVCWFSIFIISRISSFLVLKKKVLGIISIIKISKLWYFADIYSYQNHILIYTKVRPHDDHFCSPKAISYESTELENYRDPNVQLGRFSQNNCHQQQDQYTWFVIIHFVNIRGYSINFWQHAGFGP